MRTDRVEAVRDFIDGQADGERFVERLGNEFLDPDALMAQILLAQHWSADRLRGFCRTIQKALEQRRA